MNYNGQTGTLAGWGRMWTDGRNSRYLKETRVIVQSAERCLRTPLGTLLEPKIMICAYAKHADACQVLTIF